MVNVRIKTYCLISAKIFHIEIFLVRLMNLVEKLIPRHCFKTSVFLGIKTIDNSKKFGYAKHISVHGHNSFVVCDTGKKIAEIVQCRIQDFPEGRQHLEGANLEGANSLFDLFFENCVKMKKCWCP